MTEVGELLLLAESQAWQDRSRAGQGLVAHINEPTVDAVVLQLLLDAKDTAVTTATADALLTRGDLAAWQIFARAWAAARGMPSPTNHIDHLYSCLNGAMYAVSMNSERAATMKSMVEQLSGDEDEGMDSVVAELRNLVFEGL